MAQKCKYLPTKVPSSTSGCSKHHLRTSAGRRSSHFWDLAVKSNTKTVIKKYKITDCVGVVCHYTPTFSVVRLSICYLGEGLPTTDLNLLTKKVSPNVVMLTSWLDFLWKRPTKFVEQQGFQPTKWWEFNWKLHQATCSLCGQLR